MNQALKAFISIPTWRGKLAVARFIVDSFRQSRRSAKARPSEQPTFRPLRPGGE